MHRHQPGGVATCVRIHPTDGLMDPLLAEMPERRLRASLRPHPANGMSVGRMLCRNKLQQSRESVGTTGVGSKQKWEGNHFALPLCCVFAGNAGVADHDAEYNGRSAKPTPPAVPADREARLNWRSQPDSAGRPD